MCYLQSGVNFAVCDAGGSTVDTTLYHVEETSPKLVLKELRDSACECPTNPAIPRIKRPSIGVQEGAIFVNQSLEAHLRRLFMKMPSEDMEEAIESGLESFEKEAKRAFASSSDKKLIKVGGQRFTNKTLNVHRGNLKLDGWVHSD